MTRHCDTCGRPLLLGKVLSRRYRKLRSGAQIGARAVLITYLCPCGAKITKPGAVMTPALHTRSAA
jgi:hypothetical protein